MAIRAKRREDKVTIHTIVSAVLIVIKAFLIFSTLITMPILLGWGLVLTFIEAPIIDLLRVLAMLIVCLIINCVVQID